MDLWYSKARKRGRGRGELHLTASGFTWNGDYAGEMAWSAVTAIHAWKEDCITFDRICLGFTGSSNAGDFVVVVDDEQVGFDRVLETMEQVFPQIPKDWWGKVAFPAFQTNHTQLYPKSADAGKGT